MQDNPLLRTRDVRRGILATIGGTPLVELARMFPGEGFRLFAKLESFNPGGSIKDRTAFTIVREVRRA